MNQLPQAPPPPASVNPNAAGRGWKTWILPAATFVAGLVLGAGLGAAGDAGGDEDAAKPSVVSISPSSSDAPSPSPSPSPDPVVRLTKQDIELTLKTKEKQCFGSAGCNVTVQVRASLDGAVLDALPSDGTWDVTYQISGDESGPIIGTFSVYGNGKYDVNEEFLSTPSANTPVDVKVVSVERFR
jgi:hypothetical protein